MKDLKIATKIILVFLFIGLTGISILGFISFEKSKSALMKKSYEHLIAIREIKKNQIENYFSECFADIRVYSENSGTQLAAERFIDAFNTDGLGSDKYEQWRNQYEDVFRHYIEECDYYDIFIISPQGDVVYTVAKEDDLGQNLVTSNLAKSGLGEAFKKSQSGLCLIDFSWYDVSNDPASFLAIPLRDYQNKFIGVLAYQISLHAIDMIMTERSGMG